MKLKRVIFLFVLSLLAPLFTTSASATTDETKLTLLKTITGSISPKSVQASNTGLVSAHNMMYRHSVTIYDAVTMELKETIPDSVELSKFGLTKYSGNYKGAPVEGAFSPDDARTILKAGMAKGLLPRIHANQLQEGQGVRLGVELDAASVDHVSHLSEKDIEALSKSKTVATLLPGAEFSTRSAYPDVRPLLEASITVALASDCNPGSSYTTSMAFIMAVAVREMHFSPEQALWSATMGGAKALRRDDIGHLFEGARANFSILKADSYIHLAYRPGVQLIEQVWRDGLQIK